MCGIAGIVSFTGKPVTAEELWAMCNTIAHRGPDDEGYYFAAGVGLGMRRLSIIDLQTGRQPVRNEDASVWVVLNGEIYNYRELRSRLERLGHHFYTATDTEVIVHLYEEYGENCVAHLRGMFAFALWDTRNKSLFLARDRLGIKPLYYVDVDGRLAFASELKSLLCLPELDRRMNWHALNHLLAFLTTPADQAIVEGVSKLEPGHTLTILPSGKRRLRRYWDVRFEPEYGRSEDYFVEQARHLLEESVRLHMVSDVPVGAFLSGGVDSSSVVATMAAVSEEPIKTFSIGFREREYDESAVARRVAEYCETEHQELILDREIDADLERIAWHLDEPFGDPSSLPTYMVSRLAAQHVSVVLSGDGGDELFAGYDKYVVEARERRLQHLATPVRGLLRFVAAALPEGARGRNFLRHYSLAGRARYLDAIGVLRAEQQARLFRPEVAEQLRRSDVWQAADASLATQSGHWLSALQYFDLQRYLPLDILTKVDRMTMAHSLEARVPLLDHKLVEFAATIPPPLQLRGKTTKYIFKRALRGILPDEVITRRKQGFGVPLGQWFRHGSLAEVLREYLTTSRCRQRGLFNCDYVEQLIRLHEKGRALDLQLWTLLSFELWCRVFLDAGRDDTQRPERATAPRAAYAGALAVS